MEGAEVNKIEREQWTVPEAAMHGTKKMGYLRTTWGKGTGKDWKSIVPPHQALLRVVAIGAAAAASSTKRAADGGNTSAAKRAKKAVVKKKAKIADGSEVLQVDYEAPAGRVYIGEDGTCAYNATLKQTDLERSINKYYIIQVLETPAGEKPYCCYRKWGRTGEENARTYWKQGGDFLSNFYDDPEGAVAEFCETFKKCTAQDWQDREDFVQRGGKYDYIELAGQNPEEEEKDKKKPNKKANKSMSKEQVNSEAKKELQSEVSSFVSMITDQKMMAEALEAQNVNIDDMPLGSLSMKQKEAGYKTLSEIQEIIFATNFDPEDKSTKLKLKSLSNTFYTKIPHVFDKRETPPIIDTKEELKQKLDLIDT